MDKKPAIKVNPPRRILGPYEILAESIVGQAIEDYMFSGKYLAKYFGYFPNLNEVKSLKKRLNKWKKSEERNRTKKMISMYIECETFFSSEWSYELSDLNFELIKWKIKNMEVRKWHIQ